MVVIPCPTLLNVPTTVQRLGLLFICLFILIFLINCKIFFISFDLVARSTCKFSI